MQNLNTDNLIIDAMVVFPTTCSGAPPEKLLDSISLMGKKSLNILFYDYDAQERLAHDFAEDFNSISDYILNDIEPTPEQFQEWVALFVWFKRALKNWSRAEDPNDSTLTSLLLVAQFCQKQNSLWKELPPDIVINESILTRLSQLLAGLEIPKYETASLEWPQLRDAERSIDWLAMDAALSCLEFPPPTLFQFIVTDILSVRSPKALEDAICSQRQVILVLQQQETLSLNQSLTIGTNTNNSLVKFATLLKLLAPEVRESSSEQYDATDFLQKLSQLPNEWSAALSLMISSPHRSVHLHSAIAKVLANGKISIQPAFIEHLKIISGVNFRTCIDRQAVSTLLKEFHNIAPENVRLSLWEGLHEKWVKWRFGVSDNREFLHQLSGSAIDYACVGYAVECVSETELNLIIQETEQKLSTLHHQWFRSVVHCKSEWFVLLSRLKLYKYASRLEAADDWIFNDSTWDHDLTNAPYVRLKWE